MNLANRLHKHRVYLTLPLVSRPTSKTKIDRPNSTNTMVAIAFVSGEWSISCHGTMISR